jgi:putative flippase GtrA
MQMQMQIKIKHVNKDYECALILGLIIGFFLLPIENNFFHGLNIIFANLALVCGMPLLCLTSFFVAKLLFEKNKTIVQFIRFALIGVANTAVNVGIFNYFVNITGVTRGIPVVVISAVAFLAGIVNSYIWNSHWAFKDGFTNSVYQFERFFLVTFMGLLVNIVMVIMVTTLVHQLGPEILELNVANLIGVLFAMVWNFFGYRHLVFKEKK